MLSRAEKTIETTPWIVPGVLLGAFVLTRLPFGMLTGMALGFAAGWSLRSEQGKQEGSGRGREWIARHEPDASGTLAEDEKVDEMSEDSFPASDPPAYTATRAGKPRKS
jgi:hypothetical protein